MEEKDTKGRTLDEPVVYQAVISVKIASRRALRFTGTVVSGSADTPARTKKKLLEELTMRYEQAGMPAKIEIRQLKKIRSDFFMVI